LIKVKKCWNCTNNISKVNNHTLDITAFHTVFFAYFGSCTQTIGLTLSKIKYEKLIFKDDSQTDIFSKVWILRINCYA